MEDSRSIPDPTVIEVERCPAELPLLVLVILASIAGWLLLALTVIGGVYAALIALFFFVAHVSFVAHVRGSAVRIGPDQFPDLHAEVLELSRRAGLRDVPQAYLMQAGGDLNALAVKLFRARMIVLFSDLLEACGDDRAARDMILGHEVGHIRAGHLGWMWVIVPGMFVPFLGSAYSRARERTCDRWGAALCGDRRGARIGLSLLAAGAARGPKVNALAFARQRDDLDTGFMTLARWLSGYPPLCERIALVDPDSGAPRTSLRGPARALGILALVAIVPLGLGAFAVAKVLPKFRESIQEASRAEASRARDLDGPGSISDAARFGLRVRDDLDRLALLVQEVRAERGAIPPDTEALYEEWWRLRPEEPPPLDPADGKQYGYAVDEDGYEFWSSGPDGASETPDDIVLRMKLEGTGSRR